MVQVANQHQTRNAAINIRASVRQRELIDRASQALGKSRTEFILDTTCREATDVLLDQRYFQLDADAFDEFVRLLDAPAEHPDRLRRLSRTPAPWE